MDWTPTEMQQAVTELASQILTEAADPWAALAEAELLGLDDALDVGALLVEVGRAGGGVPVLERCALAWPILSSSATPPDAADVLTGHPASGLTVDDERLTGRVACVPAADRASRFAFGACGHVWEVAASDVDVQVQQGTNGDALAILTLDGVPATRLGGADMLAAWTHRVHLGIAALQLGLAREALRLTSVYVRERQQFGVPIGSFQAVSQRAGDAWIDVQAMEVTLWQAAWRLAEGLPCAREVAIARWVASQSCHRVVAAAQHLHGGFGFDRDYALHRYFLTAKQWELVLGGASAQLQHLGDLVAASARP